MPLNGYSNQPDYQSTVPVYSSHIAPSSQLATPQYQLSLDGTYVLHSQDTGAHSAAGLPFMLPNAVANSTAVANNTFRLHRNDVSSRFAYLTFCFDMNCLDPVLGHPFFFQSFYLIVILFQASSSRLDPSLEINRNLTNWGLTYKAGQTIRPLRRTWDNKTFAKSEIDLSSHPEFPPGVASQLQVT